MGDFFDQVEFWTEIPPPNVSLALLAQAHGAKFGSGAQRSSGPATPQPEAADPVALQAMFGQSEPVPYRAPQLGLSLGTAASGDG